MKILKFLGWLIIPYIMIFVYWKRFRKPARIVGVIWAVIALIAIQHIQAGNNDNKQQVKAHDEKSMKSDISSKSNVSSKSNTAVAESTNDKSKNINNQKSSVQPKTITQNDFQPKLHPEVTVVARRGGLGDTFDELKKQFGEATRTNSKMKEGYGQYNYQDDYQVVMFEEGRVSNIAYQLDRKNNTMSETQAKDFILSMMPSDSTFIKQYDIDENTRVFVYHSKALESLFDPSEFNDSNGNVKLGQFDIVFALNGNEVDSIDAMIGDNP